MPDNNFDIDPEGMKRLANAVILSAIKQWHPKSDNRYIRSFLEGDDFIFWSSIAGLNIDGPAVISALEKNGGIFKVSEVC